MFGPTYRWFYDSDLFAKKWLITLIELGLVKWEQAQSYLGIERTAMLVQLENSFQFLATFNCKCSVF